jgi:hypothetical protein
MGPAAMTPRATRRLLWATLLLVVPLPVLVAFGGHVPVVRFVLLAGVCVAMRVAEGPGGVVWQLTALFLAHALVYAVALWGAAWAGARLLAGLPRGPRVALLGVGVGGALLWALLAEPYETPFGSRAHANLIGVLR